MTTCMVWRGLSSTIYHRIHDGLPLCALTWFKIPRQSVSFCDHRHDHASFLIIKKTFCDHRFVYHDLIEIKNWKQHNLNFEDHPDLPRSLVHVYLQNPSTVSWENMRGKGLPDPSGNEWNRIISFLEKGHGERNDQTELVNFL